MQLRYKIYLFLLLLLFSFGSSAQADTRPLRIVDTLSAAERTNRNPILLRSEVDSLVKQHNAAIVPPKPEPHVKEPENNNNYLLAGLAVLIAMVGFVIFMVFRNQKKINRTIAGLNEKQSSASGEKGPVLQVVNHHIPKDKKGKTSIQSLESKINDLDAELNKLSKENEGLNRVIKEYNGIQHEYESLKHGIQKAYKVKNYPGYDKTKDETLAMQTVLDTEYAVATYAYEKFLKPILAITDANKNSPAKINSIDQERLLDLLVSLSLLYIEYLYLRVNELSIGGKMVERIQGLSKGNGIDASLLKKLNTEFGSRALVIKMALNKTGVHGLSYPVFDETNLNH
jgi:hypothetical protein